MHRASPLRVLSLAAIAAIAMAGGYLLHRQQRALDPDVPFERLPQATQMQFKMLMTGGDQEWDLYEKNHSVVALWDALDQYADAYRLHPRNREAVAALERSAKAALLEVPQDDAERRAMAQALSEKSEYLRTYPPVLNSAK